MPSLYRTLTGLILAVVLAGSAAGQEARPFGFTARFLDTQGQSLFNDTGNNQVFFAFTNRRTGEQKTKAQFDTVDGHVSVSFASGAAGDSIDIAVQVSGSAPATAAAPATVAVTSGDVSLGRASRTIVLAAPAATRSMRLVVQFLDAFGRSMFSNTGNSNIQLVFTNLRTGEVRGRNTFDDTAGHTSVTFSSGGNQSARAGDRISIAPRQLGPVPSDLCAPRVVVVTGEHVRSQSASVVVTLADMPAMDSFRFIPRYLDPLGRSLFSNTGNADVQLSATNQRTGETRSRATYDDVEGRALLDFSGGGARSAAVGDVITVRPRQLGSRVTEQSFLASFVLTAGDLQARSLARPVVAGGPAALASLRVVTRMLDPLRRGLFSVTGNSNVRFTFRNQRSGETLTRTTFDDTAGNLAQTFTGPGNQAAVAGDVIEVSAAMTGSSTVVYSEPETFVVTAGDLQARQATRVIRAGARPFAPSFTIHARLVDSLDRGLFSVFGNSYTIRFTNRRTGEVVTRTTFDDVQSRTTGVFNRNGNQSAIEGDEIEIRVLLGARTFSSVPAAVVLTAGDFRTNDSPVHTVRVTDGALTRNFTVSGTVRNAQAQPAGSFAFTVANAAKGLSANVVTAANGTYSVSFTPPLTRPAGEAGDLFTMTPGPAFLVREQDVLAGRRTVDFTTSTASQTGLVLEGQVRDAAGKPVPGALVSASFPDSARTLSADPDGAFRLRSDPLVSTFPAAGTTVDVTIAAAGHPVTTQRVTITGADVSEGQARRTLTLPTMAVSRFTVGGVIRDASGRPLREVGVRVRGLGTAGENDFSGPLPGVYSVDLVANRAPSGRCSSAPAATACASATRSPSRVCGCWAEGRRVRRPASW